MKYLKTIILVFFILLQFGADAQTYNLIWSDEFNGSGLPDTNKWGYEEGRVRNNELQYFTKDRVENARQENGNLIIEARKEPFLGSDYTSASLISQGKGDWLYGKVEIRAKMPSGTGTWPALWMMPTDAKYGGWPKSGEIDILEYVGKDVDKQYFTVHYEGTDGTGHEGNQGVATNASVTNAFLTYTIIWTPSKIEWFCEGNLVHTYLKTNDYRTWPFNYQFFLILNLAWGGNWGGQNGIDDTKLPAQLMIDYVRVYQLSGTSVSEVGISPTSELLSVNGTRQLVTTVIPATAINKNVTFSSSNSSVATVSSAGLITAVGAGDAIIMVTTTDGNKTNTMSVHVTSPILTSNPISNPGFEEGLKSWSGGGTYTIQTANITSGSNAIQLGGTSSNYVQQTIAGLNPGSTYTLKANAKVSAAGIVGTLEVKNFYGDTSKKIDITSNIFTRPAVTFSLCPTCSSVVIGSWVGGSGSLYADDFILVSGDGTATPAVTSVSIAPSTLTVVKTGTFQLTPTIVPYDAVNTIVSWTSSNTAIATVNSSGLVTGVGVGTTNITVTTADGDKTAICSVTVTNIPPVTNLVLNPGFENGMTAWDLSSGLFSSQSTNVKSGSSSAKIGGTLTSEVKQTITGLQANKNYVLTAWAMQGATNYAGYIGVKEYGGNEISMLITAVAYTKITIPFTTGPTSTSVTIYGWIYTGYGIMYVDDFDVRVASTAVTGITLDNTTASLITGSTKQLTASILPVNATNQSVIWSTNNSGVASVSSTGLITAVAAGSATITVTTMDGAKTATCTVTVTSPFNLVLNPGFENGLTSWLNYGTSSVQSTNVKFGTKSAKMGGTSSNGVYQIVSGLNPNTNYVLKGWGKVNNSANTGSIGVKNFGGTAGVNTNINTTAYQQVTINFTTGPSNTTAEIYGWIGSPGTLYIDGFQLYIAPSARPSALAYGNEILELKDRFSVYPNPISKGMLNISLPASSMLSKIVIRNMEGKIIVKLSTSETIIKINAAEFRAGQYLIELVTGSESFIKKFIVL